MWEKLLDSSFDFSIRLVELVKYLNSEDRRFPLAEHLLNCGNGIGINLRMAARTAAGRENYEKMAQAGACAAEIEYTLEVMAKTGYLTEQQSLPLREECAELAEMIRAEERRTAATRKSSAG